MPTLSKRPVWSLAPGILRLDKDDNQTKPNPALTWRIWQTLLNSQLLSKAITLFIFVTDTRYSICSALLSETEENGKNWRQERCAKTKCWWYSTGKSKETKYSLECEKNLICTAEVYAHPRNIVEHPSSSAHARAAGILLVLALLAETRDFSKF